MNLRLPSSILCCTILIIHGICKTPSQIQMNTDFDKVIVGYWHNWNNADAPAIRLRDVSPYYTVICVAFAESHSPTDMTMKFIPDPSIQSEAEFIEDVLYLQSKGKKILLSLGGQNGTVVLTNEENKLTFISSMNVLIKKYSFNGIDIDLENGDIQLETEDKDFVNPKSARLVNLIQAIRTLQTENGSNNFWITAAPEIAYVQGGLSAFGGIWGAYLPVLYGLRDILTYVHVQYYNTGSTMALDGNTYVQGTADFIVAMTDMLVSGFTPAGNTEPFPPFKQEQVAIGLPAVAAAAGGGFTNFPEIVKALDYITKGKSFGGKYIIATSNGYPKIRGIMTWSINWDKTNGYQFGKTFSEYFALPNHTLKKNLPLRQKSTPFFLKSRTIIFSDITSVRSITIYTSKGVHVVPAQTTTDCFDMTQFSSGTYFMQLWHKDNFVNTYTITLSK